MILNRRQACFYTERLKESSITKSLSQRCGGDLITVYSYVHGMKIPNADGLFNLVGKGIKRSMAGS